MFEIGEYIVHDNIGVCKVDEIGPLNSPGIPKDKLYYTLSPCYTSGSKVFTPVDTTKIIMRPVIGGDEAKKLVENIGEVDVLWIQEEKQRENDYKEAFRKCDCMELVRIIKTIYYHKQERLEKGKKTTAVDDRYFKMAEDRLYGELAISLDMNKDDVKNYIVESMENKETA